MTESVFKKNFPTLLVLAWITRAGVNDVKNYVGATNNIAPVQVSLCQMNFW
jgi:hypothetical protein